MNSPTDVKVQRILFRRVFPTIGAVGLAITVATNFAALLVFKKAAAEFLSPAWWSAWFPSYLVWTAFLILGLAGVMLKKEPDQPPEPTAPGGHGSA